MAAAKKKAAKKKAAPKSTRKAAEPAEDYNSYFDDADGLDSMGGGLVIPAANPKGDKIIVRYGKGNTPEVKEMTGIVAKSFIMRAYTPGVYSPGNPKAPACVSVDEQTGVVRKEDAPYMGSVPGFTGSCPDCPLAYASQGCQRYRMAYFRRTDVEENEERPIIALRIPRTSSAGATDCYEPVIDATGRNEAKSEIKVTAKQRVGGGGSIVPGLAFEVIGDADLTRYGKEMKEFLETVRPQVEAQQILPAGGTSAKQLTDGGPRKAEDVTFSD